MAKKIIATVAQIRQALQNAIADGLTPDMARGSTLGWYLLEILRGDQIRAQADSESNGEPLDDSGGIAMRIFEGAQDWECQIIICRYAEIKRALGPGKRIKDHVRINDMGIVREG